MKKVRKMAKAVCLFPRPLKVGMRGNDVLAMKRALSRAGYGRWKPFTKLFGGQMEKLLKKFQRDHGLKPVDGIYGPVTHRHLARFYDSYGMKLMNDMHNRLSVQSDPARRMVDAALEIYNFCRLSGRGTYTQSSRRMSIVRNRWRVPFSQKIWLFEDCSSSVTGACWNAGVPDPNGLGYNGQGYTGTLSVHGFRVMVPSLGSLGFYGYRHPYTHVVMCVGLNPTIAFSWGSGLPKLLYPSYRSDFNHWRSGYAKNPD
jgi:peptidoglycan hydrolase-like protein with peptidoglycan-binding domain